MGDDLLLPARVTAGVAVEDRLVHGDLAEEPAHRRGGGVGRAVVPRVGVGQPSDVHRDVQTRRQVGVEQSPPLVSEMGQLRHGRADLSGMGRRPRRREGEHCDRDHRGQQARPRLHRPSDSPTGTNLPLGIRSAHVPAPFPSRNLALSRILAVGDAAAPTPHRVTLTRCVALDGVAASSSTLVRGHMTSLCSRRRRIRRASWCCTRSRSRSRRPPPRS